MHRGTGDKNKVYPGRRISRRQKKFDTGDWRPCHLYSVLVTDEFGDTFREVRYREVGVNKELDLLIEEEFLVNRRGNKCRGYLFRF